jgi:hypothetical protein
MSIWPSYITDNHSTHVSSGQRLNLDRSTRPFIRNQTQSHAPYLVYSLAGLMFYGRGELVRDPMGRVLPGCEKPVCDNGKLLLLP